MSEFISHHDRWQSYLIEMNTTKNYFHDHSVTEPFQPHLHKFPYLLKLMTKKGKKKHGAPGAKRGAPDHFRGFKCQFLESQANMYQQALDSKKTSEFYDKITRDFIIKYGDTEPFEVESAEEPPTPSDNAPMPEYLDEGAAAAAAQKFSKLCTVSNSTSYIP
jgi:hypothetical protein